VDSDYNKHIPAKGYSRALSIPNRKPVGSVTVDRSHWAGKHLRYGQIFNGGSLVDIAGGVTGDINGSPAMVGDAMDFDGIADKVDTQFNVAMDEYSFLIMFYPEADPNTDYSYPFAHSYQAECSWDHGGVAQKQIGVRVGADWFHADHNGVTGEWNHVAGTYSGETLTAYLNGIFQDSDSSMSGVPQTPVTNAFLGGDADFWEGKIRHVFYFDKCFDAAAIAKLSADPYQIFKRSRPPNIFNPLKRFFPIPTRSRRRSNSELAIPDRKPVGEIEIDWNNPINRNLDFMIPAQVQQQFEACDLVSKSPVSSFEWVGDGTRQLIVSEKGFSADLNQDTWYGAPNQPQFANVSHMSFAGWFRVDTLGVVNPMFGLRGVLGTDYWSLDLWSDNKFYFSNRVGDVYKEASVASSGLVSVGEWFHYAFVFDGSLSNDDIPKLYIDGELVTWDSVDASQHTVTGNNTTDSMLIGNYGDDVTQYFRGQHLCSMGWTRSLEAHEVKSLYHNTWQMVKPKKPMLIPAKEREITTGFFLPNPRYAHRSLKIPNRKPYGEKMILDQQAAQKHNMLLYMPMLYNAFSETAEMVSNGAGDFTLQGNVAWDNGSISSTGDSTDYLSGSIGQFNELADGASLIRLCFGFEMNAISNVDTNRNTLINFQNDAANALLVQVDSTTSTEVLLVGGRSVSTDAYQLTSTNLIIQPNRFYQVEIIFDYANSNINVYLDGQEEINSGVTWGNATYTAGSPSIVDALLGDVGSTRYSDAKISHLTMQKNTPGPHDLPRNPYQFLLPAPP
jgi:hypothetical protein